MALYLILLLLFLCSSAHVSPETSGFSLDLIHREFSPLSPFYNPSATHSQRLENAIGRSKSRLTHLHPKCRSATKSACLPESIIRQIDGQYLMKLLIGTPPVEALVDVDTGSDLTWIQCKPCKRCFQHVNPLFNPKASSTYKTLKCNSRQCKAYDNLMGKCTRKHNKCRYNSTYVDGSSSYGHLATETLTLGKAKIEKYVFGCGHDNRGSYYGTSSSGVLGLGGGPVSIISQLEESIQGKFSYCLVSFFKNETSTIHFGEQAQASSSKAVSTPFFQGLDKTSYYLYLEKIIVGNKSFEVPWKEHGGYIESGFITLDSGSMMTYLPRGELYNGIVSALKEAMGDVETIDDPEGNFHFCYKTNANVKPPVMAFQFKDATLEIPQSSTFIEVADGVNCFTVAPTRWPILRPIFGSIMQWNLLVSYDLQKKMVTFQASDCSQQVLN